MENSWSPGGEVRGNRAREADKRPQKLVGKGVSGDEMTDKIKENQEAENTFNDRNSKVSLRNWELSAGFKWV